MDQQTLRDINTVLQALYVIRAKGWDIGETGREALARLDPEFAANMAEREGLWAKFKRACSMCGR